MRRIVVTGLGLVSPLGCGSELAWSRLLSARSGLAALPEWAAVLPARVAGTVPTKCNDADGGFDPDLVVPPKDQRRMDRFILFALAAASEAIARAAWMPSDAHTVGCLVRCVWNHVSAMTNGRRGPIGSWWPARTPEPAPRVVQGQSLSGP